MASLSALTAPAKKIVVFYLAVPVTLGLVFGVLRADYGRDFSLSVSLQLWPLVKLMLWLAFGAGTWVVCRASTYFRSPPLWFLLGLGALLGKILTWPVRTHVVNAMLAWQGAPTFDAPPGVYFSSLGDSLTFIAGVYLVPTVTWVGICYMFLGWLGPEFFGLKPENAASLAHNESSPVRQPDVLPPAPHDRSRWQPSGVLAQIPDYNNEPIICVASDGNYVRLHSRDRHWMVRYTFRTAMAELSAIHRGHQVHRGFWVRDRAVTRVRRRGRVFSLELENGMKVPVARTYTDVARQIRSQLQDSRAVSPQTIAPHH